jgi:hypothetical protein
MELGLSLFLDHLFGISHKTENMAPWVFWGAADARFLVSGKKCQRAKFALAPAAICNRLTNQLVNGLFRRRTSQDIVCASG